MVGRERDPRGRKPTDKSTPYMRAYWREQYRKRTVKEKIRKTKENNIDEKKHNSSPKS